MIYINETEHYIGLTDDNLNNDSKTKIHDCFLNIGDKIIDYEIEGIVSRYGDTRFIIKAPENPDFDTLLCGIEKALDKQVKKQKELDFPLTCELELLILKKECE